MKRISAAYKEYESLFLKGPKNEALSEYQPWDHKISLKSKKTPSFGPIYQQSVAKLQYLKKYINKNLAKSFIRPSTSSAASPTLFVPKKDGKLRLYVDYRMLNSMIIKDKYPLLLINELHNRLQEVIIFTTLNIRGAYNLIRMKKGKK